MTHPPPNERKGKGELKVPKINFMDNSTVLALLRNLNNQVYKDSHVTPLIK